MNLQDLYALLILLPATALLLLLWWAWGSCFHACFPGEADAWTRAQRLALCGFATCTGILQIWHVFLPVRAAATAVLLLHGLWFLYRRRHRLPAMKELQGGVRILLCVLFVFMVRRFREFQDVYDVGMYHLPSIRWIQDHALVPGLGNLNMQLGLNQSPFLWSALCNVAPLWQYGHVVFHLALTLLVLLPGVRALGRPPETFLDMFRTCQFPILVFLMMDNLAPEPAPDYVSWLLCVAVLDWLAEIRLNPGRHSPVPLLLILGLLFTVKLSLLFFILGCLPLLPWWFRGERRFPWRGFFLGGLLSASLVLPWMFRSWVLTGYPLFPSTALSVQADWRIPPFKTVFVRDFIRRWGRASESRSPEIVRVLNDWGRQVQVPSYYHPKRIELTIHDPVANQEHWVRDWFRGNLRFPFFRNLTLVFLLFFPLGLWRGRHDKAALPLFLPVGTAVLLWWVQAPTLRFAYASLLLLPTLSVAATFLGTPLVARKVLRCSAFFLAVLLASQGWTPQDPAWRKALFPAKHIPKTHRFQTRSGLILHIPKKGSRSYNGPLPGTPYDNPYLVLRHPHKGLAGGFRDETPPELYPLASTRKGRGHSKAGSDGL